MHVTARCDMVVYKQYSEVTGNSFNHSSTFTMHGVHEGTK